VQQVFQPPAQLRQHVLEGLHARIVGLSLLGREHRVEGCLQLRHVTMDLVVGGIRQDHEGNSFATRASRSGTSGCGPHVGTAGCRMIGLSP